MDYNLVTNLETCYIDIPHLLYYSHIPTAVVAIIIGLFVFFKNRNSLVSKILLFIAMSFALWSFSDLVIWINPDSRKVMFLWSWINLLEMLVSVSALYFAYVFLEKKDVSFKLRLFFGSLLTAFIIFIPTRFNLTGFGYDNCESLQGPLLSYYHILEAFFSLWLLAYLVRKIKNASKGDERKKVIYLSLGVIFFLLSFSGTNIFSSITTQWEVLQYGLFGMVVFMGFLAYLIVKYKAFNIKMLAVEALVAALVILVTSELFFTENATNQILILITMAISLGFGYMLIKSVKNEVKRKDELQLMSDKLAQANDKLTKLDNAKSEFISIASHQLRTPLTAIKGFLSLLLEGSYGKLAVKQEDVLNKVYTSNERLVRLVEDLLNVSRMESGRMEFKLAKTKIEDICQEVIDTFVIRAKEHDLKLEYVPPKVAMPELMVDGVKIREVVSNLVDNAIKYTPTGGVKLRLEVESRKSKVESKDEQFVKVIISDTGIGVPKTELPYLFSKFSRGKDVSRLNTGGTGLGLYVGKGIVEANGGHIWAESDGEGQGSRFIIELPVEQSEELMERWG